MAVTLNGSTFAVGSSDFSLPSTSAVGRSVDELDEHEILAGDPVTDSSTPLSPAELAARSANSSVAVGSNDFSLPSTSAVGPTFDQLDEHKMFAGVAAAAQSAKTLIGK